MTSRARSSSGVVFVLLYKWNGIERIVQHKIYMGMTGQSLENGPIYI